MQIVEVIGSQCDIYTFKNAYFALQYLHMIRGIIFDIGGVLVDNGGDPVRPNKELLEDLKNEYRMGIISNRGSIHDHEKNEARRVYEFFDVVVLSGEVGFFKPQKEIYEIALERMGLSSPEAVFVDDDPENVEMAEILGMYGVLYNDPSQLRDHLLKLGVKIKSL